MHKIQIPVSYSAILSFSENTDVSHEDSGRMIKINTEEEKVPYQWQLDNDSKAILKKANKTTDLLLKFLDDNQDEITEWKDSNEQKEIRSLIINTASDFDKFFPIDKSRVFFRKIISFLKSVEITEIKPIILTDYDDIKTEILANNLSDEHKTLLELVKPAMVLLTMATAIKRLNVSVLPDSIVQKFESSRNNIKATQPLIQKTINQTIKDFKEDASIYILAINEYYDKINKEAENIDYTIGDRNTNSTTNKHFKV